MVVAVAVVMAVAGVVAMAMAMAVAVVMAWAMAMAVAGVVAMAVAVAVAGAGAVAMAMAMAMAHEFLPNLNRTPDIFRDVKYGYGIGVKSKFYEKQDGSGLGKGLCFGTGLDKGVGDGQGYTILKSFCMTPSYFNNYLINGAKIPRLINDSNLLGGLKDGTGKSPDLNPVLILTSDNPDGGSYIEIPIIF